MQLTGGEALVVGDCDNVIHIAVFQCQQHGDHFGKAANGKPGIGVHGIHQRSGVPLEGKGSLGGVQPPFRACQRDIAIHGAAAIEDAHTAKGKVNVGRWSIYGHITGFRRYFLGKSNLHHAEENQQQT